VKIIIFTGDLDTAEISLWLLKKTVKNDFLKK